MYSDIILTKLDICLEHIKAIETHFGDCANPPEFFTKNKGAQYDATLMRLQALGENVKKLSEKHPEVINDLNYRDISYVIKFRDYIAHHYEKLEQDIVFDTCKINIPDLKNHILRLLSEKI